MQKKSAISLYWKCQVTGWSLASLYWALWGYLGGHYIVWIGVLQFLSDVALYILITHLYHQFALRQQWQMLELKPLILRLIPAMLVLAVLYFVTTLVKVYLFRLLMPVANEESLLALANHQGLSIFIAGVRLMSIWLLAHHLYYYGKRELGLARENARLALAAKDAQMNTLQTQLNPHFLFNALNTIKALVIDEPSSARRAIDLMSDLLRSSLYNNALITHTIKEELDLVSDYLELEKLRLEDRLRVDISCPPALTGEQVLRFSIQTLVENAIKHGVSRERFGGLLRLVIIDEPDRIKISVENPGTHDTDGSLEGLGLRNITERLQLFYQGKASFAINEESGIVTAYMLIPKL